ncbi:YdcF family protein [Botryobacter ruber]|uniref:YdcF family protein n=1 Tax=Botryobacter ruber TaxID=2171629 RepID=UPI000E0A5663|nr:YdcF family protein [Botryobacter ruber]
MFYVLSKLLHYFLMPFLWILALLLLALFLKSQKWRRLSLVTAVALLLLLSNPFLANEAWRAWEVDAVPLKELGQYDVAVILGGVTTTGKDGTDRVHTNKGADRFLHPLHLYRLGKIKKFILSGGHGNLLGAGMPEAEQLKKVLVMAGVPAEDIITESNSRNTRQNAENTAAILRNHPELRKVLLVTSAFHMRRSEACFNKVGLHPDVFSTDFYATNRQFTPDETIVPSAVVFTHWQLLLHEIAGYIVYKIAGYS